MLYWWYAMAILITPSEEDDHMMCARNGYYTTNKALLSSSWALLIRVPFQSSSTYPSLLRAWNFPGSLHLNTWREPFPLTYKVGRGTSLCGDREHLESRVLQIPFYKLLLINMVRTNSFRGHPKTQTSSGCFDFLTQMLAVFMRK